MSATTVNSTYGLYCNPRDKRKLSPSFQPGPYDVICARGKEAFTHEGNVRFRSLVRRHQDAYAAASTKYKKSQIVTHVGNIVRNASPEGGFVKLIKGVWYEVGDRTCKEKIGQTFRDGLDSLYNSSTKAKARARIQRRVEEYQASIRSSSPATNQNQSLPSQDIEPADDVRSCVSIVSSGSDEYETRPSMINMTITTKQQEEESLLDTLFRGMNSTLLSQDESAAPVGCLDLEPLPLDASIACPIEFNETEISQNLNDSFRDDMREFYKAMDRLL
ncbi:Nitrilase family, member 2 [Seminavis robusta]|uniref:Nitrilase family, member 2 n=1 Tax=Seminavis robusta TaxID=568900 RepID=A0A9N8H5G0_9STRA|nr:Nitrilase family, member 2 [Seminavis robusta]|eukprot:Sro85_g045240.1 Nitrilase family, member 2 (275) ;mRNA; f:35089-35913